MIKYIYRLIEEDNLDHREKTLGCYSTLDKAKEARLEHAMCSYPEEEYEVDICNDPKYPSVNHVGGILFVDHKKYNETVYLEIVKEKVL